MKQVDFPAGHSMDTSWYAIDKDGNIGFFDTGGAGALPFQFWPGNTGVEQLFENYSTVISPGLRQLFLDKKTVQKIVEECRCKSPEEIISQDELMGDSHFIILNEEKKWEDLNLENFFATSEESSAVLLSPDIPLYMLIFDWDCEKEILAAIKNKVIAAIHSVEFWSEGMDIFDAFRYSNEEDCGVDPYERLHDPETPLHVSQLSPKNIFKIPYFKDISFRDTSYLQPQQFMSCYRYCSSWFGSIRANCETYDALNLVVGDDKQVYILTSSKIIDIEDNVKKCFRCRKQQKLESDHFFKAEFYQDYPSVILLRERYKGYENRPSIEAELLMDCLSESLAISGYDCYATACVKCELDKKADTLTTEARFCRHCHIHLNSECAVLQPLLMISVGDAVWRLLEKQYAVEGFSQIPCLCRIQVKDKNIPLLCINSVANENEVVDLKKFLSGVSDEVKAILSQPRNLPEKLRMLP
jgi:hypothetical protein